MSEEIKKTNQHLKYSWILAIIGVILFYVFFTQYDAIKIITKIVNTGFVMIVGVLFTKFWINRNENTDTKIYDNSIATAIYNGLWIIAIALVFALSS